VPDLRVLDLPVRYGLMADPSIFEYRDMEDVGQNWPP